MGVRVTAENYEKNSHALLIKVLFYGHAWLEIYFTLEVTQKLALWKLIKYGIPRGKLPVGKRKQHEFIASRLLLNLKTGKKKA